MLLTDLLTRLLALFLSFFGQALLLNIDRTQSLLPLFPIAIHGLGYKLSSTIWLARDVSLNTYVAIKILTAEASKIRNELGCLQYLSSKSRSKHPGQEYISASFLDRHFWLEGPDGHPSDSSIKGFRTQRVTDVF